MSYVIGDEYKRALDRVLLWFRRARPGVDLTGDFYRTGLVPFEIRRFELKDALTPGGTATAYLRRYVSGAWETDTQHEFELVDRWGAFRGRAKSAYYSPHADGSRGTAWNPHDLPEWEILTMQPHALMVRGLATADFTGSTIVIDGVNVKQPTGGLIVTTDPAADLTVYNDIGFIGKDNDLVYAEWDESQAKWVASMVALRSEEYMTDFQVDGANKKLQKKTRTAKAFVSADESAWTDIHTGEVCP
jgi:hypothetical protein